jgi:hypothetical protein
MILYTTKQYRINKILRFARLLDFPQLKKVFQLANTEIQNYTLGNKEELTELELNFVMLSFIKGQTREYKFLTKGIRIYEDKIRISIADCGFDSHKHILPSTKIVAANSNRNGDVLRVLEFNESTTSLTIMNQIVDSFYITVSKVENQISSFDIDFKQTFPIETLEIDGIIIGKDFIHES